MPKDWCPNCGEVEFEVKTVQSEGKNVEIWVCPKCGYDTPPRKP